MGHAAAEAMLDAREGDGRFGPSQWVPNSGSRTLAAAASTRPGADPRPDPVGGRREAVPHPELLAVPFVPPPALEQRSSGRPSSTRSRPWAGSTARPGPTDQTYIAKWWQSAPVSQLERSRPAAHRPERPRRRRQRETPRAAEPEWRRTRRSTAGTTSTTSTSGGRGTRSRERWRMDNDRARIADPAWAALITAPYPEWVSGHNCLDAATRHRAADVLRRRARGGFQITSIRS